MVPNDALASDRAEALFHFLQFRTSQLATKAWRFFAPSTYQRRRLSLMLAMLDGRSEGAGSHDLAFQLVYPNSRRLTGAQWKASGERRHTLRLLRTAQTLRDGGYRTLPGFDRAVGRG